MSNRLDANTDTMHSQSKGTKVSLKRRVAIRLHIPLDGKVAKMVTNILPLPFFQRYGVWSTDTRKIQQAQPRIKVEVKIVPDTFGYWFYAYADGKIIGRRYSSMKRTNPLVKGLLPMALEGKVTFGSALWVEPEYRRLGVSETIYSAIGQFFQLRGLYRNIGVIALNNIARNNQETKQGALFLGIGYHLHITDCINFYWQGKELKKAYEWFERELIREQAKERR